MNHDYRPELNCARQAALQAGALLRRAFHVREADVDTDCAAEEEIHQTLMASFPQYGYHGEELGFVAPPHDAGGHLWLVDPDDGTDAAEKGFRGASVSIALLREGRPVLGVVFAYCAPDDEGDLFTWAEGLGPLRRNGHDIGITYSAGSLHGAALETVLVAHRADRHSQIYAGLLAPLRFRTMPSIAYRLALVAAGDARATLSLSGPVGWDYAAGHALLLAAGLDLYDAKGQTIQYDRLGHSSCSGRCFGGPQPLIQQLVARGWDALLALADKGPDPEVPCWPRRGCTVDDAELLSRAQGCLLGQLAGDALGGLVEFQAAADIRERYPTGLRLLEDGGHWSTLAGQPTDDSELALLLARSILRADGYDAEAAARAYGWWFESHPFDIGNTTYTAVSAAAAALRAGQPAAPSARAATQQDSQANGAMMRASPLGILGAGAPEGAAGAWAEQDAGLTHPNPVCLHANRVYAESIAYAIRTGASPEDVHRFAIQVAERGSPASVIDALVRAVSRPPESYSRQMGWVLIALQNAFWQLLHAQSLEHGIVSTVMSGGDTDTNGAIAGALLGAVHGRGALPLQWLDRLMTCRPIHELPGVKRPRPEPLWPVDALWVAERLLWLGKNRSP